eukprot:4429538-Karenia_brevis.AAC.1
MGAGDPGPRRSRGIGLDHLSSYFAGGGTAAPAPAPAPAPALAAAGPVWPTAILLQIAPLATGPA